MTVHEAAEKGHEALIEDRARLHKRVREFEEAARRALEYNLHDLMRRSDVRRLCVALYGQEEGVRREEQMAKRGA